MALMAKITILTLCLFLLVACKPSKINTPTLSIDVKCALDASLKGKVLTIYYGWGIINKYVFETKKEADGAMMQFQKIDPPTGILLLQC